MIPNSKGALTTSGNVSGRRAKVAAKKKAKAKAKVKTRPKNRPRPAAPPAPAATGVDEQVEAATGQAYGAAETALRGEQAVSTQMQANIPAWYQEYRNALAAATQQTGAAYAAAGQQQANTANSSSALDAQQRAQQDQAMQADAASRGATVDPAIAAQGQQAAASRRSMLDSYAGLTSRQGATEAAFGANRQVVGAGQQVKAMEGEANRARNLATKGTELAKEKGQYAVTARQKILDAEHQKNLENKAFGLDVVQEENRVDIAGRAAEDRRAARITSNRNADESRGVQKEKARLAAQKDATQRKNKTGPYAPGGSKANGKDQYGNTQKDRQRASDSWTRAKDTARSIRKKGDTVQEVYELLLGDTNPVWARGAAEMAVNGKISPKTAAQMRKRGVTVGGSKPKPKNAAVAIAVNPGSASGISSRPPGS